MNVQTTKASKSMCTLHNLPRTGNGPRHKVDAKVYCNDAGFEDSWESLKSSIIIRRNPQRRTASMMISIITLTMIMILNIKSMMMIMILNVKFNKDGDDDDKYS